MKRTHLNSLITEKSLSLINGSGSDFLLEHLTEDGSVDLPIKNVCAKVSVQLSEQIDNIVGLLGISKRKFLEAAFLDAVAVAEAIIKDEGVWEAVEGSCAPSVDYDASRALDSNE
jgi:hypothetical protein